MSKKKPISANNIFAAIAVVLVLLVGMIGYMAFGPDAASVSGKTAQVQAGSCPDTLATTFSGDCINQINASAADYLACAVKMVPDSDFSKFTAYTAAASSTRTTGVSLKCGHNYVAYGTATIDSVNSFEPIAIGTLSGNSEEHIFQGTEFSALKANAYDNLNKAFVYDDSDATASDQESLAVGFKSTTDNATATALGVGGILDWSFTVSTTGSVGQFGDKDVGIFVALNADKSDYEIPSLYFDGLMLSDIKGSGVMSNDDESAMSGYEYIYQIPDNIRVQPRNVRLVVQGKSGVNPDVDIVLKFCAKGYYISADGFTIKKDCFNDATATEIATATPQTLTLDIS